MLTSPCCFQAGGDGLADVLVDEQPVLHHPRQLHGQPKPHLHHVPANELEATGVLFGFGGSPIGAHWECIVVESECIWDIRIAVVWYIVALH